MNYWTAGDGQRLGLNLLKAQATASATFENMWENAKLLDTLFYHSFVFGRLAWGMKDARTCVVLTNCFEPAARRVGRMWHISPPVKTISSWNMPVFLVFSKLASSIHAKYDCVSYIGLEFRFAFRKLQEALNKKRKTFIATAKTRVSIGKKTIGFCSMYFDVFYFQVL